jgi:hypothetical protein
MIQHGFGIHVVDISRFLLSFALSKWQVCVHDAIIQLHGQISAQFDLFNFQSDFFNSDHEEDRLAPYNHHTLKVRIPHNCHSGRAERDPESSLIRSRWQRPDQPQGGSNGRKATAIYVSVAAPLDVTGMR